MSGDLNIGTLTATLKGIDQLSPVLKQATDAASTASTGITGLFKSISDSSATSAAATKAQLAAVQQTIKDLEEATKQYGLTSNNAASSYFAQSLADARAQAASLTAALAETAQATQAVGAAAASTQPQLDAMAAGMSKAGQTSADSMKMIAGMSQAGREAAGGFEDVTAAGNGFGSMVGAITERLLIYASVRGAMSAIESTVQWGLELQRLSAQLGFSVQGVQELNYEATATSVPLTTVTSAISQLQRKLELEDGGAVKGVEKLGLNFQALRAMAPEQMWDAVATALSGVKDQTEFAGLSAELFSSRSGTAIAAIIKNYQDLKQQAHDANVILSDEEVKALADVASMWDTAWLKAKAYFAGIIAGEAGANQFKEIGIAGGYASQASAGIDRAIANQVDAQLKQMAAHGPTFKDADSGGAAAQAYLASFGAQIKAGAIQTPTFGDDKQGAAALADAERIAKDLTRSAEDQIAAEKKAAAAAAEHAKNLEDYTNASKSYDDVLNLIGNDLYEGVAADAARGVSTKALADIYKTTPTIIEDVKAAEKSWDDGLGDTLKAMSDNEQETAKFQDGLRKLLVGYNDTGKVVIGFTGILHTVDPALIQNAESLEKMQQRLAETSASFKQYFGAFAGVSLAPLPGVQPSGLVDDALNNTDHMTHKLEMDLQSIASAFDHIGASASGGLGQALSGFSQLFKVIERSNAEYDKIATKFGANSPEADAAGTARTSAISAAVISTAGNFIAQTINTGPGASTGSLVAADALKGMSAGATIGSVVPGIGTGIGAGIGAGVGTLAGWIQSGEEWRKVVNDISRDFGGIKVSEDFAKTIDQLESDTGLQRVQAITTQLDQLIQMAGGLNSTNFDLFFGKLHDAFSYIQQGSMTVAEVTQILDKNFADFAAAGTNAYGQINDQIRELIALDQQFGTDSQAIADWMKTQAGNMASGLTDLLTQPLITTAATVGKAVTDAQTALDTLNASGTATTDALTAAQDALTAALTTQHSESERNKQALDDLGTAALTTFNAAVASGQTFAQALEAISPQLTTITQAYKDLGLSIDDAALKGLTLENTILNGPNGTGKAVSGLNAIITAATNIGPGVETPEAIAAQQRTLASVYTQTQAATQAAGGTTVDALLPFQQSLHELLDYANKNNIALDDKTQQMINQSKELGIWTDDFETDSQKTRDSIADLINSNEHLAAVLGGAPYVPSGIPGSTGTPPTIPPGLIPPGGIETDPTAPSPIYDPVPEAAGGVGFASGPMTFSTQGNEEFAFSGEGQRFARAPQSGGSQAGSKTYNVTVTAKDPAVEEQWIRDWMRREGVDITVEEIKTGRHTRDIQSALNRVTA